MKINFNVRRIKPKCLLLMSMRAFLFFFCTTVLSFNTENSLAQDKVIIEANKKVTVEEVFQIIMEQTKYSFLYPENLFEYLPKVQLKKGIIGVENLINQSISRARYKVILSENNTILINRLSVKEKIEVSGKVSDVYGVPISGVYISIKGTSKGTISDFDGGYTIEIFSLNDILVYNSLGFKAIEVLVGSKRNIDVILEEDISKLDEVVVIGYGTSTQRELTGSVESIAAKEIEQQQVSNVMEALQGRMTGVVVKRESGRIGSSVDIQIRGLNSIRSGSDPLYVIDGVPVSSNNVGNYYFDPMSVINPSDIASIEVLKDADATAIYGSRGSNGVILISTKKARGGKIQFDVDISTGISTARKVPDMLSTRQYLEIRQEALSLAGIEPDNINAPDLTEWDPNAYTDWSEYAFGQTASRRDLQVRVSGGKDHTRFTLGGGYFTHEDLQTGGAVQERITSHVNIIQSSENDRFKGSFSVNYSFMGVESYTFSNSLVVLPPNYPIYNENMQYYWDPKDRIQNPVALQEISSKSGIYNILGSADLSYEIFRGFDAKAVISYNRQDLDGEQLSPTSSINPLSTTGSGLNNSMFRIGSYQALNFEPQLHYETMLGRGRLQALLGGTWMHQENQTSSVTFEGFSSDALLRDWGAASNVSNRFTIWNEYKYKSIFARLNYNWSGTYIINLTARRDGSSRFGPGRQWGNFWAVGGAWQFSNEDFIHKWQSFLSYGKLRASYGLTGNDQIADYGYQNTYRAGISDTFDGRSSLRPTLLANPNYSWESTKKLEVALELGFLKDRLLFKTAWYRNHSDDQLIPQIIPSQTGFNSFQANLPAQVANRGWEFELQTENIRSGSFLWGTALNVSLQKNELLEYPSLEESSYANLFEVGQPLDRLMLYSFEGIDPTNGRAIFTDYNADGKINNEDDVYIGPRSPRTFGGFRNSFTYKGFQLDVFVQFAQQWLPNWKYSFTSSFMTPGNINNVSAQILTKYWQNPGDLASLPSVNTLERTKEWQRDWSRLGNSDAAYDDIFYARLKTLSLSWTLPSDQTKKTAFNSLRLFVRGQDLGVFTSKDIGKDPETNYLYTMPFGSTWSFGLQLSF